MPLSRITKVDLIPYGSGSSKTEKFSSLELLIDIPLYVHDTCRALGIEKAMHSMRDVSPGVPNCLLVDVIAGGPFK